jgi:hypothetical protein
MTSIVQDIQAIRSLRKDLSVGKEVKLPSNILNSIETIHNCIKSGTDLNGWKKVEWRNGPSAPTTNSSRGAPSGQRSGGGGYNRNNTFFSGRQSNDRQNDRYEQSSSSHYAFNNRNKGGFSGRQTSEPPTSIPLTNTPVNTIVTPTSNNEVTQSTPSTYVTQQISSDGFRTVPHKYVSKFKKNSEKVEDTILNTILLGKLNKFSEVNYAEIKEFVTHIIDGGQTEMIKCFMKLVFEKAASEEMFCPLYAKLLSELSSRYPVLLTEMANLYSVYMAIFEEVPEAKAENYNEVCKQNVEKKYRRGYSQFLAELIKYNVIDKDLFAKTITTIITQVEHNIKSKESIKLVEEYADCLVKIMKAIQEDSINETDNSDDSDDEKENMTEIIRIIMKNDMSDRIKPLSQRNVEYIGLSNKARFTFLDIYEGIQKF